MDKKEIETKKQVSKKPLNYNVLTVGYPVFSIAFTTKHRLFIGGGGGVNRSGVKNVIVSFFIIIIFFIFFSYFLFFNF